MLPQFSNELVHLSFHRFIQRLGVHCGFIREKQRLSQQPPVPDTHTDTQTHTHTHTHTHTDTDSVLEDSVTVDKPNTLMQMCERTSESKSLTFL